MGFNIKLNCVLIQLWKPFNFFSDLNLVIERGHFLYQRTKPLLFGRFKRFEEKRTIQYSTKCVCRPRKLNPSPSAWYGWGAIMISYVNTICSARLNVSANILFYKFIVNSTRSARAKAYVSFIVYFCFVFT